MVNRLQNFQSAKNTALENKSDVVTDTRFLQRTGDRSKPAPNKLILDDMEAIQKNNLVIDQIGAPQTNFAPFGNAMAMESSTTPNATDPIPNKINPLFDFEPYNYIITLSAVTKESFNSGGESGEEIVIVRSGGKGPQGQGVLGNDYYIDNLVIRNTVSPTSIGKSGTVYEIMFDITEPYGTSFVDALITAAKTLGFENHLKTIYKLSIDFKGVDDEGNPSGAPIEGASRIIPMHIYGVEMRVEAGVTTYQIQALPATSLATTEVHGIIQESLTVRGETVGEVLQDFFDKHTRVLQKLADDNRILQPDVYTFSIDESAAEIIDAKIPYDVNSTRQNVVNVSNTIANVKGNTFSKRTITVPEGTAMQAFIEAVVRESDFYRNQFDQNGEAIGNADTLTAMRTVTRLNILNETGGGSGNRPQYEFIWAVRPFIVSANYFKKDAQDLASNVEPVRSYNYLYTGKNQDILDFNITYKFAFYQATSYFKSGGAKVDAKTDAYSGESVEETQEENTTGTTGSGSTQVTTEPVRQTKDGFIADLNTPNGEVATIFEQIIQDPSADLIATSLEIIGDPLWIEQKSVSNKSYVNSFAAGSPSIDTNGAVTTDEYEIYIQLNFKTPTDLDDDTGLFKIQDAAFFQGKYKVFMCESRFSGGIFTNILQMVRMRHQSEDKNKDESTELSPTNTRGGALPVIPNTKGSTNYKTDINDDEQANTTNNVSFLRSQLNSTQQATFDNLMSPTAQVDPMTAQEAYDYVLNNNVGVYVDPRRRLEERYSSGRLSPGAFGGRQ